MPSSSTPYDELPYKSFPIEWTTPERLALTALLHGGPRLRLDEYRALELGCGDGTNLIAMASSRQHGQFVGVDSAHSQVAVANEKQAALGLSNVTFVASDFQSAAARLSGTFDFIIAHGVFSWIARDARDALLALCAARLRPGGLLYLNYNARPGWNVRGLIRDFLMAQTATIVGLRNRAERAREIAVRLAEELRPSDSPYSRLLGNEFRFVCDNDVSHTAHEYLSPVNDAYSRREFLELISGYGLAYVADADFNYRSGRLPEGLASQLRRLQLDTETDDETVDLLCYRQLHSPILTQTGVERAQPSMQELSTLSVASNLVERAPVDGSAVVVFEHASGHEVEARSEAMVSALRALQKAWPSCLGLAHLFSDLSEVFDDLSLLHRSGMIEIRIEPGAANH